MSKYLNHRLCHLVHSKKKNTFFIIEIWDGRLNYTFPEIEMMDSLVFL